MIFVLDYEPTDEEMNQMYEDYMKQFGDTPEEQDFNYKVYMEGNFSWITM